MAYVALQFTLMLVGEALIIRAMVNCLTMRSDYLYIALHLSCFTVGAIIRIFGTAPLLRGFILPLCYLVFPLALSVGPLRTRLLRIALVDLAAFATEMVGVVIYSLLTGGTMAENTADQGNIVTVVAVYSVLIPVVALSLELVITACTGIDRRDDARLELPIVTLILSAVMYFFLIYMRFFPGNAMAAPLAVSSLVYCMATVAVSLSVLAIARRDAHTKREIANQMAEARQAKHVRGEVEATALRSLGLRRLRHDLSNQIHVVTELLAEGHYDDADRYLTELQAQAHDLQVVRLSHAPSQAAASGTLVRSADEHVSRQEIS